MEALTEKSADYDLMALSDTQKLILVHMNRGGEYIVYRTLR